jgi:hypothetical protein
MSEPLGREPQIAADQWAGRAARMRCFSCMYFVPKGDEGSLINLGRCRRRAPTLDGWPVVFKGDWCGDHKLDEAKA